MTNYQHPGEVREALNFQCLHCNDIFTAPQGLDGHLSRVHNVDLRNLRYKKDWDVTTNVAGDYTPVENRQPSIYSGDRIMKSEMELTHNLECLMPGCVAVYASTAGMSQHQKGEHDQGSKLKVNYQWTKKPITFKNKLAEAAQARKGIGMTAAPETSRTKRPYKRRQPQQQPIVITPHDKYIEIAAVIRVPISVGQAEIIQSGI